ncbi:MAG: VOC family protein [Candidatus Eremiobacteraeota bacterium]|nr:VOC family protein [Candidatus Eremiobacteraeota bacterium]
MKLKVSGIDAVYYTVKDIEQETRFYTDLLGAQPNMHWPGRLSEWTFSDGNSFGLYQTEGKDGFHSGSAMFAVDDVAKAVAEAKKNDVQFHDHGEVTETPACHMAFGEDPEHHQFILHKRKP